MSKNAGNIVLEAKNVVYYYKANKGKKVLIIGGGPNRIGQGIEFDYCCVHASYALKDLGIKSIMYIEIRLKVYLKLY